MEKLFSFQNTGQFLPFLCSNNSNSSSIFEQKDYALLLAFFSSSGRVMSAVREKANISINVRSTGQRFRTECPGDTRSVGSIRGLGRSSGRKWQPTPVFKPKKFHEHGRLESYGPWGLKSDTTEQACMPVEHKIPIFKLCTDYYFLTLSHTHRSWLPQYTFKMVIFTVIQSTIFFQAPYSTEIFPESSYYQNKVSNPRSKKKSSLNLVQEARGQFNFCDSVIWMFARRSSLKATNASHKCLEIVRPPCSVHVFLSKQH